MLAEVYVSAKGAEKWRNCDIPNLTSHEMKRLMTLEFLITAFKAGLSVEGLRLSFDIVIRKSGQMDRNWTRRLARSAG